jgi:hypothetical protein
VVSWCGGCKALATVDWQPLAGRSITLWPDADNPGREAMVRLSALLLELGCHVAVVLPPGSTEEDWDLVDAPGALGWDLADATWSPAEAQAYLESHCRLVRRPEPAPIHEPPAAAPAPERPGFNPAERGTGLKDGEPFTCLGYDSDGYHYQPRSTGQVMRLSSSAHGGVNLCRLAPLAYWETLYPSKRGVNWTAAASDLFSRQAAIGMFDPDLLRGRGIWWDDSRCVLHLGDRLVVDGHSQPLSTPSPAVSTTSAVQPWWAPVRPSRSAMRRPSWCSRSPSVSIGKCRPPGCCWPAGSRSPRSAAPCAGALTSG